MAPITNSIDPKPFMEWLATKNSDELTHRHKDAWRKIHQRHAKGEPISFDQIDTLSVALGHPEIPYILYEMEENDD